MGHDRQLAASCRSGPSQPPTEVRWSLASHDGRDVTGERVTTAGLRTSQGSETISSLTLPQLGDNHASISLTCEAVFNDKIILSKTKHIKILGIKLIFLLTCLAVFVISAPPGLPKLTSSLDPVSVPLQPGDTVTMRCLLPEPGRPAAQLTWYRDDQQIEEASSSLEVTITEVSTEVSCEAVNPVSGEKTRSSIVITPTEKTTTTLMPTTTTTTVPLPNPRIYFAESQKLWAGRKFDDVHDIPLADMPSQSQNSDYDYSHFEYLNENFDAVYKDTVRFADEYYDSEEYYDEPTIVDKAENSVIIKKLKEEFQELHSSTIKTSFSWCLFWISIVFKYYC